MRDRELARTIYARIEHTHAMVREICIDTTPATYLDLLALQKSELHGAVAEQCNA